MKACISRWASEPFRVFFPLGMLAAIAGVMMWPLLYTGKLGFYPGEAHSRVMIEGFMGAFVIGFLGTAFPRLTGNASWSCGELVWMILLWATTVASALNGQVLVADTVFATLLLLLSSGMIGRWACGNRDTPPPGFVMALAGILGGALAAGLLAWNQKYPLGFTSYQFAKLWLNQGFLLLPLMGIAPYLLPRFFGMESGHSFHDSPTPPPGWWPRFTASVICALLIAAGFALEAFGWSLVGHVLRATVILAWFASETPVFRRGKLSCTPGNVARFAVVALILGTAAAGLWPLARVGSLHLFFAAGLGLAVLAVATRVVLGHGGRHDLLVGRIVWLRIAAGLLVLAAATRMTSDFVPAVRVSHHIYAAWIWAAGGSVWLIFVSRYLGRGEEEPS
ncbi:NnrS family protein [Luteolibacter luteus]|uniref:NnrS family protein n=1 Tax=Luteolibacter luteus TaxID=2728835 RepID=A0A858REG2_9BACT|nr:NnrS family protein [Luteolibacter luteus]QJE95115.1 NnrS family protein [Luteolibacter luteus]